MFKARQRSRKELFERAMFERKDRGVRRRTVPGETQSPRWVPVLLWVAFALVGGYILFFSPVLMVQRVSVEGESVISSAEYQAFVETALTGSYFGIFQKRNYFLIPTEEITVSLLERYPLLSAVRVHRRFPNSLTLSLHEAPAILRWCSGGPCYGIRNGVATMLPYAEDERYRASQLSVIDESALPVQAGAVLLVEPYLESFRSARDLLGRMMAGTVAMTATTPSRHSNEIALSTGEGWRLLIVVDRPVEESLGILQVFLDEYAREHTDRSRLESVDLRVEGKVFYVEKSGSPTEMPLLDEPAPGKKVETKKKKSGR